MQPNIMAFPNVASQTPADRKLLGWYLTIATPDIFTSIYLGKVLPQPVLYSIKKLSAFDLTSFEKVTSSSSSSNETVET